MSDQLAACLRAVEEELRRWRDEGQTVVDVSDAAMEVLRDAVHAMSPPAGDSPKGGGAAVKSPSKATRQKLS